MMSDFYTREESKDSKHVVILKMTLPADAFAQSYERLLQSRSSQTNIKGFRKGKVPGDMIEPQLQSLILNETFEQLAPYYVNAAIMKEKLQPIAPPEYTDLKDLVKGKPVEFTVRVITMPDFKLPDMDKVKVKRESSEVKDEEVQKTLETMYRNNEGVKEDAEVKLTDEWAKKIGKTYQFEDVKDLATLKEAVKKLLATQKQNIIDQNAASDVLREAVKAAKIEIPAEAVKYEAQEREAAFMQDIKNAGVSLRDFLQQRNITLEKLKEMWEKDAQEALENDALLKAYAQQYEVQIDEEELQKETEQLKKSAQAQYEIDHAGHDHPNNFDESVYDDPQWQEQIRSYLAKQKAYRDLIKRVLGEEFFAAEEPAQESKKVEELKKKSSKPKKESKSTKKDK